MTSTRHTQDNDVNDDTDNDDSFHDVPLHEVPSQDEFLEEKTNKKSASKCLSTSSFFSQWPAHKVEETATLMGNRELKFNTDSKDDENNQAAAKNRRYCLIV